MQLFYDPDLQPGTHALRDVEAQHAFRVLRKRVGDRLDLVDGRGGWYSARVTEISKRQCLLDVREERREATRAAHRLALVVAPTKNIDRFEWLLEKATEIGVDAVYPVLCEHSERKRLRNDRLERILEAAMKQSLRAWKPTLHELAPLENVFAAQTDSAARYLAYLGDDGAPLLGTVAPAGQDCTVAVGPEGGFSPREAELARAAGFAYVSLGPHRLRTETAALAAVHTLEALNWRTAP